MFVMEPVRCLVTPRFIIIYRIDDDIIFSVDLFFALLGLQCCLDEVRLGDMVVNDSVCKICVFLLFVVGYFCSSISFSVCIMLQSE